MCYNIIQYAEYSCRHQIVTREQKVDCHARDCCFSRSHRTDQHNCVATCKQQ
ncbi:hypothetical protein NEOLEDRAFT_1115081 [Neolentinus lepideus HHB14362 ss-1]|uniref:Uncharacterized protein n=1 Tax=Neolentinus lepideus HHB14362 ss-1 TaxID=1314782 RepID=A0A165SJK2_9AGAM|nr:hypothetical protein NEOLEDRAFT_1115081 [Neolentinus lepideus HHB14362 ss-1]